MGDIDDLYLKYGVPMQKEDSAVDAKNVSPGVQTATHGDISDLYQKYGIQKPTSEMSWKEYLLRKATGALPAVGGMGGAAVGSLATPVAGTIAGGAGGYAAGAEGERVANNYLFNDPIKPETGWETTKRVGGNLATGAVGAAGGLALRAVGEAVAPAVKGIAGNLAERFATSPIPSKVASATDLSGKAAGLVGKFLSKSPTAEAASDYATPVVGRMMAYKHIPTAIMQGVSDAARVTNFAQKGMTWALDNAAQLGPYGQALQEAAAKGGEALTYYMLHQNYPKFREMIERGTREDSEHPSKPMDPGGLAMNAQAQ